MIQIASAIGRIALRVVFVASALAVAVVPSPAQTRAERPTDKDVKLLLDQVDEGRDKFEGNLDGAFKGSTIRNANGETKVAGALQDYQDSTQKLKARFTADYSASAEAATVLKQSSAIHAFMQRSAATMKGRSEWDRQAANMQKLAAAYGVAFPLADGAVVRRMNDKETAAAAAAIGAAADQLKDDLDKATGLTKPEKDAAKKDMQLVTKQAELAKSRISDGKPASSEVQLLISQVAGLQTFVAGHALAGNANWQAVRSSLAKLQQAFGLTQ